MRFMLNHYFRCLCYITGDRTIKLDCHREIENLVQSRKECLTESLEYFQFFYLMGERGSLLQDYFNVLDYLRYVESSLVALRFASLPTTRQSYAYRYLNYALTKKDGVGGEADHRYAVKVFTHAFYEAISSDFNFGYLQAAIMVYHLATIFDEFRNQNLSQKLLTNSLLLIIHSPESVSLTKKFIYFFVKMLRMKKYLDPSGTSDARHMIDTEPFAIELWKEGFHLAYNTNEEYIY